MAFSETAEIAVIPPVHPECGDIDATRGTEQGPRRGFVHHFQVQRRAALRIPIDDRHRQKWKWRAKVGGPEVRDGTACAPYSKGSALICRRKPFVIALPLRRPIADRDRLTIGAST